MSDSLRGRRSDSGRRIAAATAFAALCVLSCTSPQDSATATKSVTSVPTDTTPAKQTPPPVVVTGPTPVNTSTQYDPVSRHWPHIRIQVTDYRIGYLSDAATRETEYQWAGAHGDDILLDASDARSMPKYRQYDPNGKVNRYVLNWTVIQFGSEPENNSTTYTTHMQAWYAAHSSYQLENAFLHDGSKCSAGKKTLACRVTFKIWNSPRFALNPGDAGARAYQRDRFKEVISDADGLFLDEHGSGDMSDNLSSLKIVEYPSFATYQTDMVSWLADLKAAVAPKTLAINTATYISSWDTQMAKAAGGSHAEGINNPFRADLEQRWDFMEALNKAGAAVEMVPAGDTPTNFTAGSSATALARRKLFQLASYYMVVPSPTDLLRFNWGPDWTTPYSTQWYKAIEVDVGKPTGVRQIMGEGKDPAGHSYRVWSREFENAVVFVRPVIEWTAQSYDDGTALTITMPAGDTYLPLSTDGTVGAPTDRVTLRASESAILLRKSRMQSVAPTP
jgi:hypothetical protein